MKEICRRVTAYQKNLFFFFSFLLFSVVGFSQTVTGTVTDADNKPVSRATVQVKGTDRRTQTDDAGRFSINASGNDVLFFSNVGYLLQEVRVNGQSTVNVTLAVDNRDMATVVVTALGIRRDAKKLGYATTTVKTDEMVTNRTTNAMESLEGKVAGLNITPPAAGAGASTQIRLRGQVVCE